MEMNEEDWCVECSDDEKYENDPKVNTIVLFFPFVIIPIVVVVMTITVCYLCLKEGWLLKPDDIVNVINKLECNNHILELEWKCPGRRPLSPVQSNNQQDHLPEFL